MSSIDKLSILGVRSFDNSRSETIAFHKPLTLIVGLNGSGKTTIIECLKYATTGELPPNSKVGGAFVHDPKLCGEKEVLAQVKLSFKGQDGNSMIVTRSLQLTVKKTTRSCKELEGTMVLKRNAEKHTMSSRKADLDAMMPYYLGVSKAILSSVIFCHQEDSLWPLSQPAELKKRFDEIFEALKYTKAIENIKIMQKKKREDLIRLNADHEMAKHNKECGQKIEAQADKLSKQCDELRKEHADFGDRIKQAVRNAEEAWKKMGEAELIVGKLSGKRIERKSKEESVTSLKETLVEMEDSDHDLQRMLEQYDERVSHIEEDLASEQAKYSELGGEIQQARNRVSQKERECGSHEAEEQSYKRQIITREKLVKETARSHGVRGFDLDVDDGKVADFMERVATMAREHNAALEKHRRENQEKLQEQQREISGYHAQKKALDSKKDGARQTIATNDRKIGTLHDKLNRIDADEGKKAAMESDLREKETKLNNQKADEAKSDLAKQAQEHEAELRKLDDRKEKLDAELVEATRRASDSAQVDYVQKEQKARELELETLIGAHRDKISAVVGSDWGPDTLEEKHRRTLERSTGLVTEAERQRDGTSREKDQLDFQYKTLRKDLTSKQATVKGAEDKIKRELECTPEEYTQQVANAENARDIGRSDTESAGRMKAYFDSCIKLAQGNQPGCRTCGRGLKHAAEVEKLVSIMEKQKAKLDEDLVAPEDLEEAEAFLKTAKDLSADFEEWERLKEKELPALKKQEDSLKKKREALDQQLEEQDSLVNERQAARREIDQITRTVQSIVKHVADIAGFKAQYQELVAKQKSAGMSRGLGAIQEDIKTINEESRARRSNMSKINTDRERMRNEINRLELEVRDIKGKISTADYQLREKIALEQQVEELKSTSNNLREEVRGHDAELRGIQEKLAQANAKYEDLDRAGEDKDRELQNKANKLNNSVNQLKLANQEIEAYLSRGGPEQLKRGKREVDALKREVANLEEEQRKVAQEANALKKQQDNHKETRISIINNQRYRRDLRALEQVRRDIDDLEQHNAEDEKAKWEREASKWQTERNKLSAEQATVMGSLKSKDETLGSMLDDYNTEYKDSASKYKKAHIMVETTKACVEDLGRYSGALDKAVMRYHSLKMEEINRIIDDLWRNTYQGTDVDTILIRSENENVKSNKSYNYRVCMIKSDAEMDMRGRCSAGQKVLASIIIRLALADCFGINCGLIALDEPTTNLDRENIRALAESLGKIIKVRRQQKNFQLIVITHDEEFLKHMGCSDFCDVYYRVSRTDAQTSQIERQSIAEVV